jgi:integrase
MRFCVGQGFIESDPTDGIKIKVPKSDGHATWTEDEIVQFRAHWAPGTMERLAMELALNTGQRVSDLIRMGRQHARAGVIKIKQQKTGTEVEIPIHPELAPVLELATSNMTFLINGWNKPFTSTGFSEWFGKAAKAAGLPTGYTAHGLRKGCAKRLADQGCNVMEIAAITGHKSIKEIERYTAAYDRRKAARAGMAKLVAGGIK